MREKECLTGSVGATGEVAMVNPRRAKGAGRDMLLIRRNVSQLEPRARNFQERREGGCRIYVPPAAIESTTESGARMIESTTESGARMIESTTETGARVIDATTVASTQEDEATTKASEKGYPATTGSDVRGVELKIAVTGRVGTAATEALEQNVGRTKEMIDGGEKPTMVTTTMPEAVVVTEVTVANMLTATVEILTVENTTALLTGETTTPTEVIVTRRPLTAEVARCTIPVIHTVTERTVLSGLPTNFGSMLGVTDMMPHESAAGRLSTSVTGEGLAGNVVDS